RRVRGELHRALRRQGRGLGQQQRPHLHPGDQREVRGALQDQRPRGVREDRSEEHTSELQSREKLVCRLLLEKKKEKNARHATTPLLNHTIIFSFKLRHPPRPTLFPYTTLFRSSGESAENFTGPFDDKGEDWGNNNARTSTPEINEKFEELSKTSDPEEYGKIDRKSTRLNSSHVKSSYAVFCLKKKKKRTQDTPRPRY